MTWEAGFPLVTAEQVVDYQAHLDHILEHRARLEEAGRPTAKRIGMSIVTDGVPAAVQMRRLADIVATQLEHTARFGYRTARAEVTALREKHPLQPGAARAALEFQDVGMYGEAARQGLVGIGPLLHRRGRATADRIVAYTAAFLAGTDVTDQGELEILAGAAGARAMHNAAIELVGEALNLGRTAGVSELGDPPRFAMRSEQLDRRTCAACTGLHGEIVEINSAAYFDIMPPSGCFGGGRCRGIFVYADDERQVRDLA